MAILLGKRKRVEPKAEKAKKPKPQQAPEPADDAEDLKAIFARAFEAKFKPLDGAKKPEVQAPEPAPEEDEDEEDEDEENEDWEGISEEEDAPKVEVVEHTGPAHRERADKSELKAFMSSKPPSSAAPTTTKKPTKAGEDNEEGEGEAMNLKNDLALQRLLKESHLLDANDILSGPTGKSRHKATDMRLQALGSKKSILHQEKMPMSHRKGIVAKAAAKESKRRQEAKENGIILEKPTMKKVEHKKRERGVGGPGIGRFSGGTLRLSKADIASISGPSRGSGGRKGRR